MNRLSLYVGRTVEVHLNNNTRITGYFERLEKNRYYIVLRDGSRMYFRDYDVRNIYFR